MEHGVTTELKVPDLWFDFYARLLPGSAAVAAFRFLVLKKHDVPELREMALWAFGGYLIALLCQPLSSRITGWIEDKVEKRRNRIREIQAKLGRDSREAMILSKMHGEVTFFTQLAVLALVLAAIQAIERPYGVPGLLWNLLFAVLSIGGAREVAGRRFQRAKDYEDAFKNHGNTKQEKAS